MFQKDTNCYQCTAVGAMAEEEVRILNSVISDLETELKTKGKTKQSRLAGKSEKG